MISLMAGMGLGLVYFGGLWLTVQRLPAATRPALLTLSSFLGRLALCVLGFYGVTEGDWGRLLLCLLGFLSSRTILLRRWGPHRV
jgi:F1F0 ATPase subunit 2